MRRLSRLERLEKSLVVTIEIDDERQRRVEESRARREAAWAIMSSTMSKEHVQMVVEAYAAGMQDVRHPDWDSPGGTLLRRCLSALSDHRYWPYTLIKPEVAFAMQPVVADVYLRHVDTPPLHSCEDCGYRVPHKHFTACPLCGGRVGWYAYWHKHKDDPRPPDVTP